MWKIKVYETDFMILGAFRGDGEEGVIKKIKSTHAIVKGSTNIKKNNLDLWKCVWYSQKRATTILKNCLNF